MKNDDPVYCKTMWRLCVVHSLNVTDPKIFKNIFDRNGTAQVQRTAHTAKVALGFDPPVAFNRSF
jgi:hypothetical protein